MNTKMRMETHSHVIPHAISDVSMMFLVVMNFVNGSTATYVTTVNALNVTLIRHVMSVGIIPISNHLIAYVTMDTVVEA
jgi:hypothetical protein